VDNNCVNYLNCGNKANREVWQSNWCRDCYWNLTVTDKFYVVGFEDAWVIDIEDESRPQSHIDAYKMGVADRLGVDSAQ
jgi:hypothetical protein